MTANILIVEDEPRIASLIQDYLVQSGYSTQVLRDGATVVDWVKANEPDLMLLDLMLPNKDGLAICREVKSFSPVPIIMITARVDEIDRLLGLELGADDYICKPFSPREVVARVKAVLRRMPSLVANTSESNATPKQTRKQTIQLNDLSHQVEIQGKLVNHVTTIEFKLLKYLLAEPGRIFSRDQLMDLMYNDHRIVSERTVDSHIKKLRKKLQAAAPETDCILSVYGVGYKYED